MAYKYLKDDSLMTDMDSGEDTQHSTRLLESRMEDLQQKLIELPAGHEPLARADLLLDLGRTLVELQQNENAWDAGREAFDLYAASETWEGAVQACDILFSPTNRIRWRRSDRASGWRSPIRSIPN